MAIRCSLFQSTSPIPADSVCSLAGMISGLGAAVDDVQLLYRRCGRTFFCRLRFDDRALRIGLPRLEGRLRGSAVALGLEPVANREHRLGVVVLRDWSWVPAENRLRTRWCSRGAELIGAPVS